MKSSWPLISLADLVRLERRPVELLPGESYQEIGVYCFGRGIFHKTPRTGFEIGNKKLFQIREGDFILQITFAWEGAVAIASANDDGLHGSVRFLTFRVDGSRCDPHYLRWYFRTPAGLDQLVRISPGSAGRNRVLSIKRIPEVAVPVPPLSEQRRIVAKIEQLAERIEEARGVARASWREADTLLPGKLRKMREVLLRSGSEIRTLGEMTTVTAGGTPTRNIEAYWNGLIPWVKTGELLDNDISGADECITEEGLRSSSAKLFPRDTILIALYGQGQTRGRTGRLLIEAATNQACCAILPSPVLRPRYTQYWLRSLYYEMREQSHGGAQPNWNGKMIKSIEVALPPMCEQERIVAYLDNFQTKINALKKEQTKTSAELDALLPSILDLAFRGEL